MKCRRLAATDLYASKSTGAECTQRNEVQKWAFYLDLKQKYGVSCILILASRLTELLKPIMEADCLWLPIRISTTKEVEPTPCKWRGTKSLSILFLIGCRDHLYANDSFRVECLHSSPHGAGADIQVCDPS